MEGTKRCVFVRILQAPMCCIGHKICFRKDSDLRRHISQVHGKEVGNKEAKSILSEYDMEKNESAPLSADESKVCASYWRYYGSELQDESGLYPNEKLPILPMLKLSKHKQCTKCYLIISNEQKLKPHKNTCGAALRDVLCQTILGGNATRHFRVGAVGTCGEWFSEDLMDLEKCVGDQRVVPSMPEISAIIGQLRFHDHLIHFGVEVEEAWGLLRWNNEVEGPDVGDFIYKLVQSYIRKAVHFNSQNVFVKTHEIMGQRLHLNVSEKTISEYTRRVCHLVYFLYHVSMKEEERGKPKKGLLGEEQADLFKSILEEQFTDAGDNQLLLNFHRLAFTLFFSFDPKNVETVPLFIACCAVQRKEEDEGSFHFGNGTDISPMLAALLYFIHCIVVHEVYGLNCVNSGEEYDEYFSLTRGGGSKWESIDRLLERKEDCGASYTRFCMNVCRDIAQNEMSEVRFTVCHKHVRCGFLDGKEMSLGDLGGSVRKQQKGMWKTYEEELLFGFCERLDEGFWADVGNMKDNFRERKNRYYFVDHPANFEVVERWRKRFGDHIFDVGLRNEDGSFDKVKGRVFLEASAKVVKNMFWMLQVTSGGPARGSELAALHYRNSFYCSRHLFLHSGRLMYVFSHHKARNKLGGAGKPIARFPDLETSKLLLVYIFFIRPLEDLICWKGSGGGTHSGGNSSASSEGPVSTLLFCSRGIQQTERMLTKQFEKLMLTEFEESWKISDYRQYHTGVIKNFVNTKGRLEDDDVVEVSSRLHEQSGHGINTANAIYGVSELDMRKLDSVQLEVWFRASCKWHKLLFEGEMEEVGRRKGCVGGGEVEAMVTVEEIEMEGIIRRLSDDVRRMEGKFESISKMQKEVLQSVEEMKMKFQRVGEGEGDAEGGPAWKKRRLYEAHKEDRNQFSRGELEKALRQSLGDSKATFRNKEQEESINSVCNGEGDGMFILPTGSGKSQLFMILPFIRKEMLSVVIVPLVALQVDLMKKCQSVGIHGVLWKDRFSAGVDLVFCSCEHVTKQSYASFIKEMWKTRRLFMIFVDEAHLIKQWSGFRPVLGQLEKYIRPAACNVRIQALTATCPPSLEPVLKQMLSLRNVKTVRQDASRGNISYRVLHCFEEELTAEFIGILREVKSPAFTRGKVRTSPIRVIVYCLTRNECDALAEVLSHVYGRRNLIRKYHAGMGKSARIEQSKQWMEDSVGRMNVMVATSAFGCGIDIPDVAMVIHIRKPRSIIGFLQESGRAGRNGHRADSIVMNIVESDEGMLSQTEEGVGCFDGWDSRELDGERSLAAEYDMMEKTLEFSSQRESSEGSLFGSLNEWVKLEKSMCRRWMLEEFCDGKRQLLDCIDRNIMLCDLCESKQKKGAHKPEEEEVYGITKASKSLSLQVNMHESQLNGKGDVKEMKKEIRSMTDGCRTPPVSRRMMFEETEGQTTGTMSQSQSLSANDMLEIVEYFEKLCAVCSVKNRKEISHSNQSRRDDQTCESYKKHCYRCASKRHRLEGCFTLRFKEKQGWCHKCSLSTHANGGIHPSGTYGTKDCPIMNCIRFITMVFEDIQLRVKMNNKFPDVRRLESNEQLLTWLRSADQCGHTWIADVIKWIREEIVPIL